jgi:hypothetical protein
MPAVFFMVLRLIESKVKHKDLRTAPQMEFDCAKNPQMCAPDPQKCVTDPQRCARNPRYCAKNPQMCAPDPT